ncbi:hypothetical protein [Algivirga pacifica]|uniref:Uncharacterized protein n=1 Tax=Algivirga pacifica TaxID=1162670 RepID=A0ABP9D6J3_9BACT
MNKKNMTLVMGVLLLLCGIVCVVMGIKNYTTGMEGYQQLFILGAVAMGLSTLRFFQYKKMSKNE